MRKLRVILCIILALVLPLALIACTPQSAERVVITVEEGAQDVTLAEYMKALADKGELKYSISGGMVTEINGVENSPANNAYWMLYTDDAEFSNEAWGTVEHEGKTFASATLGAETLIVKGGCTYIWVYAKL